MSWTNSTGGGGAASHGIYKDKYGGCDKHVWSAYVPIAPGPNVITINAAHDNSRGSQSVTVNRVLTPAVVSTNPFDRSQGATAPAAITATFNKMMDPATLTASSFTVGTAIGSVNGSVNGSVSYADKVATFTPATSFQENTWYTATVAASVKDAEGFELKADYVWSFRTGMAPDVTPPSVVSTSPRAGGSCAPVETDVTATFDEPLSAPSIGSGSFVLRDGSGNVIAGTISVAGLTARLIPDSPLQYSSFHTATITAAVADLADNHPAADYTWTFTTEAPGIGSWSAISLVGAPSPRKRHTAVWTGTEMIVWGGGDATVADYRSDGARYDPATNAWHPVSGLGAPAPRASHFAVWTGSRMIVWGGLGNGGYLQSGAIYDPASDTWTSMSSAGAPRGRTESSAVWTGSEFIVWGGYDVTGAKLNDGARYDPATDSWSPISTVGAPTARGNHKAVWTGFAMLVWGGRSSDAGGAYTPSLDAWVPITPTGAPGTYFSGVSIWDGAEMVVWGGEGAGYSNAVARYDPAADAWQSFASPCAPAARRRGHSGIWSGSELIVWGGELTDGRVAGSGGRYDPGASTWRATTTSGAPSARTKHTAVWTGTEMIVWGGEDAGGSPLNSGGRYRP